MNVKRVCVSVVTTAKNKKNKVGLTNFRILIIINHFSRHKG